MLKFIRNSHHHLWENKVELKRKSIQNRAAEHQQVFYQETQIILQNLGEDPCLVLHRLGSSAVESGSWSRSALSRGGLLPDTNPVAQGSGGGPGQLGAGPGPCPALLILRLLWVCILRSWGQKGSCHMAWLCSWQPGLYCTSARWVNPADPTHLIELQVRSHPGGNKGGRSWGQKLLRCLYLWALEVPVPS